MNLVPVILILTSLAIDETDIRLDQPVSAPESPAAAVDRQEILKQALADFDAAVEMRNRVGAQAQELFRRSLSGFEMLLRDGPPNGYVYYNIANAHLRLGDIGRAVANYRRALRLCPGDARIRKNLQAARDLCKTPIPVPAAGALVETVLFWHYETSASGRLKTALAAYVVFWALLSLRLFVFRCAPAMTWMIRAVAAVALITAVSVAWDGISQRQNVEGVIVADEAVLRKGNSEYYEPLLDRPLSSGVEFRVLESRQDVQGGAWYLVRLRDGKEGWLRSDQADII